MYDIVDFIIKNADEIKDYDIIYYRNRNINNGSFGEIEFELKNGEIKKMFIH